MPFKAAQLDPCTGIPLCLQAALWLRENVGIGLPKWSFTKVFQEISDFSAISSVPGIPNLSVNVAVQRSYENQVLKTVLKHQQRPIRCLRQDFSWCPLLHIQFHHQLLCSCTLTQTA